MSKPTKSKQYLVNKSYAEVYNALSDLEQFGELHPLILETNLLGKNSDGFNHYRVKEKPYKGLPFKVKYEAIVLLEEENLITYDVSKIPFLKPKIIYTLTQVSDNQTLIQFDLYIKGLPLAKSILANKMLKAQDELMKKM